MLSFWKLSSSVNGGQSMDFTPLVSEYKEGAWTLLIWRFRRTVEKSAAVRLEESAGWSIGFSGLEVVSGGFNFFRDGVRVRWTSGLVDWGA